MLRVVRQSRTIDEVRILHAELLRALVHPFDKGLLGAGDLLGHGDGAVVGGGHGDALEHFVYRHLLALLQPDLAAAHGRGVAAGGHHVVFRQRAAFDLFGDQQQGHDLRHTRGRHALVPVFLVQKRAGRPLHKDGGRRGEAQFIFLRRGHGQRRHGQQREQKNCGKQSFHSSSYHQPPAGTSSCAAAVFVPMYDRRRRISRFWL